MSHQREPLLPALFGARPVITDELWLPAEIPPLAPAEARAVVHAVEKRREEYAAGRACARRALSRLGIDNFALASGTDRAPLWPDGIVGSITHTGGPRNGYCGVAVARADEVAGLGLDAELARPLDEELWDLILTPHERATMQALTEPRRGAVATAFFSAKESVYKAVYPTTQQFLEFHDVEVSFDLERGAFTAEISGGPAVNGVFWLGQPLVLTAAFVV